jgi:AcrR family transcriptional regulator
MPAVLRSREDALAHFRRTTLIDAAHRVFGTSGFERATMDAIAQEADVAKGTIYLYYPSKRAIYDAAFDAGMADLERLTAIASGRPRAFETPSPASSTRARATSRNGLTSSGCTSPR